MIDWRRESFLFSLDNNIDQWAWRDARLGRLDVWNDQWWDNQLRTCYLVQSYWTAQIWIRVIVWDLVEVLDFLFGLMNAEDSGRVLLCLWRMRRWWLWRDQNILLAQRQWLETNLLLVVCSGAILWTCMQILQVSRRVAMLGRSRSYSWRHLWLLFLLFGYESSWRHSMLKRNIPWNSNNCGRILSHALISSIGWLRFPVHISPANTADLSLLLGQSVYGLRLWFSRVYDLNSLLIRFLGLHLNRLFSFDWSFLHQSWSPFASLWLFHHRSLWFENVNRFYFFFRRWFWLDLDWWRPSLLLWPISHGYSLGSLFASRWENWLD